MNSPTKPDMEAEREAFESWFEPEEANRPALRTMRRADTYPQYASYLRGCWEGWKARSLSAWNSRASGGEVPEPFVVRHYSADERTIIKGNGFDGLQVGADREEAQQFVDWINIALKAPRQGEVRSLQALGDTQVRMSNGARGSGDPQPASIKRHTLKFESTRCYYFQEAADGRWVEWRDVAPLLSQADESASPPSVGWQPIEAAPNESLPEMDTPVWLYEPGRGAYIGERGMADSEHWLWANCYMTAHQRPDGTWANTSAEQDDDYQPTHWMPLPPAPSLAGKAASGDGVPGREGGSDAS